MGSLLNEYTSLVDVTLRATLDFSKGQYVIISSISFMSRNMALESTGKQTTASG